MSERPQFRVGTDWGQKVDHSAVCIVEEMPTKAVVRFLWKYRLNTSYPKITEDMKWLFNDLGSKGTILSWGSDATGVGSEPTNMLQRLIPEFRIDPWVFNNKNKRNLVGKVKVMHSFGQLKFAMRKGDALYNMVLGELITEMKQLQARVIREDASNPEIEVFKTGQHDDLFTALALAVKDIDFQNQNDWSGKIGFVADTSWVRTPLDERGSEPPIAFF